MGILMVRHTTPRVAPGTCYGQTDLDLTDGFASEAEAVLQKLPPVTAIISSPLTRCHRLARVIAKHRQLEVTTEPRLIEMDFGAWEGLAWNDIPRGELDAWADDFIGARPHGGETVGELKARVDAVIREISSTAGPTLLVTHAGVIRAALANGREAHHFQTQIDFGGIIRLPDAKETRHDGC